MNTNYTLENYYTISALKRKQLLKTIYSDAQCVLIKSKGGMGGTHLIKAIHNVYEAKERVLWMNVHVLIDKIKENCLADLGIPSYKYLFIDAVHVIYREGNESYIPDFESTLVRFFNNGGKAFFKFNPIESVMKFLGFLIKFEMESIILDKVEKEVLSKILTAFETTIKFTLGKNCKELILSLRFENYRIFGNYLVYLECEMLENKKPFASCEIVERMYIKLNRV